MQAKGNKRERVEPKPHVSPPMCGPKSLKKEVEDGEPAKL